MSPSPGFRGCCTQRPPNREQVELSRVGLHWEALDEDISIAGLLAGRGDVTRSTEYAA